MEDGKCYASISSPICYASVSSPIWLHEYVSKICALRALRKVVRPDKEAYSMDTAPEGSSQTVSRQGSHRRSHGGYSQTGSQNHLGLRKRQLKNTGIDILCFTSQLNSYSYPFWTVIIFTRIVASDGSEVSSELKSRRIYLPYSPPGSSQFASFVVFSIPAGDHDNQ